MKKYYVVCKRHGQKKDYALLFWAENRRGYTFNVDEAGVYYKQDFPESHWCDDMPVLKETVDSVAVHSVIDFNSSYAKLIKVCVNNSKNRKLLNIKISDLRNGATNWDSKNFCTPKMFANRNKNTIKILRKIKKENLTCL
jgi:hypothetical protein